MQDRGAAANVSNAYRFSTTSWSMVMAAGAAKSPEAQQALDRLCRVYWYPIYAYVRRKGYQAGDAQDLTQEFFSQLIARNYVTVADRNRGKFRSFLLGSLEHFLAREWTKARAQKRGAGKAIFSLDEMKAEDRYSHELSDGLTPERVFDRRWAITVLHNAMSRLREECVDNQKGDLLVRIESQLAGESGTASYAEIASAVNMTEGAVKVAVHRLRRRYGELIRSEIEQTVTSPDKIDEELHDLFRALIN